MGEANCVFHFEIHFSYQLYFFACAFRMKMGIRWSMSMFVSVKLVQAAMEKW